MSALNFDDEQGELFGQFLGRPVEVNVLFERVEGDFHLKNNSIKTQAVACTIFLQRGEQSRPFEYFSHRRVCKPLKQR